MNGRDEKGMEHNKLDTRLPDVGPDPDHAVLVADLSWQYQTPVEQWETICKENRPHREV